METKTIYGQAYIEGSKLMQDQIVISDNGKSVNGVVTLIDDIWNDLLSNSTTSKVNAKGNWFYWEVTMTGLDGEETKISFECPKPKDDMWDKLKTSNSPWARYWDKKYQDVKDRDYKVQKAEYTLPGAKRMNFTTGEQEITPEVTYTNSDLGDITNLLNILY